MAWPTASSRTKNWGTEILTDADLEAQLDLLHTYFNDSLSGTTGHGHTGGTNDGPKLNIPTALTISSQAQGDIIYASSSSVWARLGAGTAGQALTTGGAGANPAWAGLTTQGDIEYHNGTTRTRLGPGTAGQVLQTQGAGANPQWAFPSGQLGAWASKSSGTIYQAATDGFVVAGNTSGGSTNILLTDSSNPPTTVRSEGFGGASGLAPVFSPVRKNDYYEVTTSGGGGFYMYFIPMGS